MHLPGRHLYFLGIVFFLAIVKYDIYLCAFMSYVPLSFEHFSLALWYKNLGIKSDTLCIALLL